MTSDYPESVLVTTITPHQHRHCSILGRCSQLIQTFSITIHTIHPSKKLVHPLPSSQIQLQSQHRAPAWMSPICRLEPQVRASSICCFVSPTIAFPICHIATNAWSCSEGGEIKRSWDGDWLQRRTTCKHRQPSHASMPNLCTLSRSSPTSIACQSAAALHRCCEALREPPPHIPKLLRSIIGINELINTYYRPSNNR